MTKEINTTNEVRNFEQIFLGFLESTFRFLPNQMQKL